MAATPMTAAAFRQTLGQFATGVAVVTVEREPGVVHGMTANSFTSVSLDPFLILICVDQNARLSACVREKQRFGVSVLKESQQAISEYFAKGVQSAEGDALLGIRYRWTKSRIPLLEDSLMQVACNVVAAHMTGDHTIFIGEVESADSGSGEPLLYFRSQYRQMAR